MNYKVNMDKKVIEYGPGVEKSWFPEQEWVAICHEMVKENYPTTYKTYKNDDDVIIWIGSYIHMAERYELLLKYLPQSAYSKAGTHPRWISEAVEENTLNKEDIQEDIGNILRDPDCDLEMLKETIAEYLDIQLVR